MLRYSILLVVTAVSFTVNIHAQELFVYSEPASNMPAKSTGIRVTNLLMNDKSANNINYHLIPEVMFGINKKLMIHTECFYSNADRSFSAEGFGIYAKYRFLSNDRVYRHFRMAAFVRAATNNGNVHQEEIAVNGHNTGYQAGVIATQLLHKTALSLTAYYEHADNNFRGHDLPPAMANKAISYSLSAGRLLLPKKYNGYGQTNLNMMAEIIGQQLPENGKQYIDIAPSLQLIFNSQTRLDISYRYELYSNMHRSAPNGFLIRMEHLLFNSLPQ